MKLASVMTTAVVKLASMNVDLGIWRKLTLIVIGLVVIAGLGFVWQLYLPNIKQNERMRRNILTLDSQIRAEEVALKQTKASMDTLRYDTNAIERLARERLRYAKTGETIVVFESPVTNQVTR